jgi:hypothetical protein
VIRRRRRVTKKTPDSILSLWARACAKKKTDDGTRLPASMGLTTIRFGRRSMISQVTRINAVVVALLMTASAVNGVILYACL